MQTIVTIDRQWQERIDEGLNQLARVIVDVDPITKIALCTVYTDDGKGNGLPMFSFPME